MSSVEEKLPDGWVETTLGEIANITMGQSPKSEFYNFEGNGIPFYQGVTEFNDKYVSIKKFTSKSTKVVPENTILFSVRAPVGRVNFTNNKCCIGRGNAGLYMKNNNQDFLYYLLIFLERMLQDYSSGTVFTSISGNELNIIPVLIPKDKKEQKAIANVLTAFDDKIENLRAQNQTLEQTAQTIFKEWFGKYQISDELPEGWRVGKLGDIAFNHSKSFKFTEEDVVFVNTGDVSEGQFLHANKVSPIGLPGQAKKAIELYDILYSEIRPKNKRFAFVDFDTSNYVVSTKFMIIRPKDDFSAHILYLLLKNQNTVNEFNVIAESRSGTFPQITFDSISDFPVIIPTKEFQNQFKKILRPLMEKERINHQQIQTLTKTRDALLPKLMRGEIRAIGFNTN
ncbi:restriction endonuclease subunit S [uncultured Zobellia sp.]|uniref:restriction endonuclease subunit S n=1 Tax=uncultured Zobellia sp. TaxID=255433 RepID=UPI0025919EB0|nr:restriction endonuclease subunit S [uncultured Zobellia sp.]